MESIRRVGQDGRKLWGVAHQQESWIGGWEARGVARVGEGKLGGCTSAEGLGSGEKSWGSISKSVRQEGGKPWGWHASVGGSGGRVRVAHVSARVEQDIGKLQGWHTSGGGSWGGGSWWEVYAMEVEVASRATHWE